MDLSFAASLSSIGGLTAEGTARCQAAADVLRALVASGWAGGVHEESWKGKDKSVYFFTAVATVDATAQVSATKECCQYRIHSVHFPNPFADARTLRRRRSSRTSFHPIFPPPARFLDAKGSHSRSCPPPTCFPCTGRRANGADRSVHRYSGCRVTEAHSIACQRCVGLRAAAVRREV